MKIQYAAFVAAITLISPLAATAKEDLCNKLLPPEMAVGEYVLTYEDRTFRTTLHGMDMTVPMESEVTNAILSLEGDALVMRGDHTLNVRFLEQVEDFQDWWGISSDFITDTELASVDLQLCPTTEGLPRLLGEGAGELTGRAGTHVSLKTTLIVHDVTDRGIHAAGMLYGTGNVDGIPFTFQSPVTLAPK